VLEGEDCAPYKVSLWEDIQRAAEVAYDRSESCEFSSFVAYEYTAIYAGEGDEGNSNMHRNVIFRNEKVPERAFSFLDAVDSPEYVDEPGFIAPALYDALRTECLDGIEDCDVLTIPHNMNLSGGYMYENPATAEEAAERAFFEPLVEIFQHKAGSECRTGVGTTDEDCGFELASSKFIEVSLLGRPQPPDEYYTPRLFARNVLKDGLALEQELGVNPFKFGMAGSTDTHNATSGNAAEADWPGHTGALEAEAISLPIGRISRSGLGTLVGASLNPGGLTVVWAEENSRDALFEAMRRKEVYATSGTRPTVRFFGGWRLPRGMCNTHVAPLLGYELGVPMGGDLDADLRPRRPRGNAPGPMFYVHAMKDPGTDARPGTDLQRIQIVKGWVDDQGMTQEQVYDVAGDPDNGASVEVDETEGTCNPAGDGFNELCTVWTDPDFDPDQPAFYYVRVLENPTCRWSTLQCLQYGVNPLADPATCAAQEAAVPGLAGGLCCLNEESPERVQPVIQERAWTSPIWYTP
jgi:hypothetical protein